MDEELLLDRSADADQARRALSALLHEGLAERTRDGIILPS
jgi:hypothetical protein